MIHSSYSKIEVLPFFVLRTANLPTTPDGSDYNERAVLGPNGCELINDYLQKGWELVHISSHHNPQKDITVHAVVIGKPRSKKKS